MLLEGGRAKEGHFCPGPGPVENSDLLTDGVPTLHVEMISNINFQRHRHWAVRWISQPNQRLIELCPTIMLDDLESNPTLQIYRNHSATRNRHVCHVDPLVLDVAVVIRIGGGLSDLENESGEE